jgi:hypothetical protein
MKAAIWVGLALAVALPGSASAAEVIGQTSLQTSDCGVDHSFVQTELAAVPDYSPSSHGLITSWSVPASDTANKIVELLVLRPDPSAGPNNFVTTQKDGPRTLTQPSELNVFTGIHIPIEPDERLGLFLPGGQAMGLAPCVFMSGQAGDRVRATPPLGGEPTLGASVDYSIANAAGNRLNVSAVVEPDCDADGFGDETQDQDTSSCNPPKAGRMLTLDANKNKVRKGRKVTLSGQVDSAEQGCESSQPVELQRKKPSQTIFATVEQLQTTGSGNFATKEKVKKTFEYRAVVTESAGCQATESNTEKVKVKKK